jgi:hypothetical protein
MRTFLICTVFLLLPFSAFAENGGHYARRVSYRRGSETTRFAVAARFVHERVHSSGDCYECSVRNLLPEGRGAGYLFFTATEISRIRKTHVSDSLIALTAPIRTPEQSISPIPSLPFLIIDAKGRVLSRNPVWNACAHGQPVTPDLIRSNPDTILHRQRRIRTKRPMSCRDYHRGDIRVWTYADDHSIQLVLDKKGRLLGDPPVGYILKVRKN